MRLIGYSQGRHSICRFPAGKHAIDRRSYGQHSIVHSTGWYVQRTARKTAMPAFAALLSSSMTVSSAALPLSAVAEPSHQGNSKNVTQLHATDEGTLTDEELLKKLLEESSGDAGAPADVTTNTGSGNATPGDPQTNPQNPAVKPDTQNGASDTNNKDATGKSDAEKPSTDKTEPAAQEPQRLDAETVAEATEANVVLQPEAIPEPGDDAQIASSARPSNSYTSVADDGSTLSATVTELKVANRLLDAGWTPEMIAAAIGNMYAESGSNAASFEDMSGMFNYSYEVAGGLFQWTDCGSSSGALSSAGFTGLTQYAQLCGKNWQDPTVQTEYFLKTWRDEWQERQSYYDAASPEFAQVDVSLASFDESNKDDFDGDGIVDARDTDIDGDGVLNEYDTVNMCVADGKAVQYAGDSALHVAIKQTPKQRTEAETRQHVANLTFAFMASYEGPSASVSHLDRRVAHALRMYPAILALQEAHKLDLTDNASLVVASAATMLGGTYIWGAESPVDKSFDCSGLTKWCYSLLGVDLDHYSETQYLQADRVGAISDAVPGDILWRPGHVGIYIGNGTTIEAKGKNYGIVYGDASSFDAALHFNVLDLQSGEEDSWKQLRDKVSEQAQAMPSAIQGAANMMLK